MANQATRALAPKITLHHSAEVLALACDVQPMDSLETASLWLAQCRDVLSMIANEHQDRLNDSIYGALTLLELAKGLIDHIDVTEVCHV